MELNFTIQVEAESVNGLPDPVVGDPLEALMMNSVRQAVGNALTYAQEKGFRHPMEDAISVMVMDVDPAVRVYDKARRVSGEFLDEDRGATLHCATCGEPVRSNEKHTCPPLPDPYGVCLAPRMPGLRRLIYSAGGGILHVHYLSKDFGQPRLSIVRGGELWGSQTFDPPRAWDRGFLRDGIDSDVWRWLDPEDAWIAE